jgi:hypothetical protein
MIVVFFFLVISMAFQEMFRSWNAISEQVKEIIFSEMYILFEVLTTSVKSIASMCYFE